MARVKLEEVSRRFERTVAVEEISFEVPEGKFWVLVGPSGCGKSTILRMIAGLETATTGKIYIGDTLVNSVPARQRDVAMVFQNYALYPHMSVADNLAFGLRMRQTEERTIAKRIETVARSLNIYHLLQRKPKQLSGGQQQRVALGRAIAREPRAFLLDEPLSNLDAQLREETRAELKQLHNRLGITTIYVTHDQIEAMTLGEQIVVLDRGRVQQIGSPQEIYEQPTNRMVASFLGSPAMNIIAATYSQGHFHLGGQTLPCHQAIAEVVQPREGQSFELGVRPEEITLAVEKDSAGQLQVEVELVEPLGRETFLKTRLCSTTMTLNCCLPGHWSGHRGDRLPLGFDLEKLFIFAPNTGKKLYPNLS